MTPTPVGMRCPECSRERVKVRTIRTPSTRYSATQILIALNVAAYVAELATGASGGGGLSGWVYYHGSLIGPALTGHNFIGPPFDGTHQIWRLLTAGFLHASLIHIGLNMLSLYFVGRSLEPAIGRTNFVAIYLASLLAGSFGALVFQPDVPTLGASTAIFGIFGALIAVAHARGISLMASGLGPILAINLLFTLTVSNISIGGHLGGLVAGLLCGQVIIEVGERRRQPKLALACCALIGLLSVIGGIAVAGGTGLTPNGFKL
jgi:membrane associated rhomboid family serine protease